MEKRVAMIINTVTIGGRITTIVDIVKVLNKIGIVPDIYAMRWNVTPEKIKKHFNADIQFNKHRAFVPFLGFYDFKVALLNLWFRIFKESKYDYLINNNNSLLWLPKKIKTFTYMYFPRKARVWEDSISMHLPEKKLNIFQKVYRFFLRKIYSFDRWYPNNTVYAISNFSREELLRHNPGSFECGIIYPGNLEHFVESLDEPRKNQVVTVGRFDPQKRQIEQMQIAELVPDIPFKIIGAVVGKENQKTLRACELYKQKHNIQNVEFVVNASQAEKDRILRESKFFLHTTIKEPFGLVTIESMAMGCIPLVHDSGGSRELVPWDELRFQTKEEAAEKLQALLTRDLSDLQRKVVEWSKQFTSKNFRNQLEKALLDFINQ